MVDTVQKKHASRRDIARGPSTVARRGEEKGRGMNAKMRRRLMAVSGVIVIVLILVLAFVGGNTAAKTVSVAEAAELSDPGQKVQVLSLIHI